jgi:hypothetical protein
MLLYSVNCVKADPSTRVLRFQAPTKVTRRYNGKASASVNHSYALTQLPLLISKQASILNAAKQQKRLSVFTTRDLMKPDEEQGSEPKPLAFLEQP